MKYNFKYIALSIIVLSISACASHPVSTGGQVAANSALQVTTSAPAGSENAGNMRLTLQPTAPAEEKASLGRRVVEGVLDVAMPVLAIYNQTNNFLANTLVHAVVGTASATMAAKDAASEAVNPETVANLQGLVAAASQAQDSVDQAKGLDAMQLIQHLNANYQGGQQIQNLVCTNASPRYRLALTGNSQQPATAGWIDLGIDVEVPGAAQGTSASVPLVVQQEQFQQLCQTAGREQPSQAPVGEIS